MKPWLEFGGFLTLAFGAHLLIWQGSATGAMGAAGQAGDGTLALSGASASLQDLVADWDRPPQTATTAPDLRTTAPDAPPAPAQNPTPPPPILTAPTLPTVPVEQALVADSPPPPPPKAEKPKPAKQTQLKPNTKTGAAAQRPKGQGNKQAAGQNGSGQNAAPKPGSNANQMARWGGQIRSSIERRKRYPAGSRAKGAVSLAIAVSTNGTLSALSVARSSGDAALDRAALDAVKNARLPKAPPNIPSGTHRFTLSVSFAR